MEQVIESLTALLTPVIAVIAVYIAYQQWQTNQQRLKIDLYDRRLSVYKAVTKYLNAVLRTLHPTLEDLSEFHRSTAEADFLFGPDIRKYLDDLYKHGVQLQRWKEEYRNERQNLPADYDPEARAPVYGNRRRMRGRRGRRLMRQRGERIERSFAHLYDTGGMRRTHLRGHTNILKRLLIHAGGFNLGLVMRHLIGIGTPRGLQGRVAAVRATLGVLMGVVRRRLTTISSSHRLIPAVRGRLASLATFAVNSSAAITCTTGC